MIDSRDRSGFLGCTSGAATRQTGKPTAWRPARTVAAAALTTFVMFAATTTATTAAAAAAVVNADTSSSGQASAIARRDRARETAPADSVQAIETADVPTDPFRSTDVNEDGLVGLEDLLAVLNAFGVCPDVPECPSDKNGDSLVDFTDITAVLADWD
ncbi:MAG: hypothetical protein AB8G96_08045 [Phycisphaerales bacterium]